MEATSFGSVRCRTEVAEVMRQVDNLIGTKKTAWDRQLTETLGRLQDTESRLHRCRTESEVKVRAAGAMPRTLLRSPTIGRCQRTLHTPDATAASPLGPTTSLWLPHTLTERGHLTSFAGNIYRYVITRRCPE